LRYFTKNKTKKRVFGATGQIRTGDLLITNIGKNAGFIHMLEQNRNFAPTFEILTAILRACNTTTEDYDIEAYKTDSQIIERLKKIKGEEKKTAILTLLDK